VNGRAPDTCRRADLRGRREHADASLSRTHFIFFPFPSAPYFDPFFALLNFISLRRASRPIGEFGKRSSEEVRIYLCYLLPSIFACFIVSMDFEAVYLSVHSFLRRSVRGVFAVHFFCAEPLRFLSLQHPNIHLSRFKSKHFWKFQTTQTKRTISLSLSLLLVSHEDQKKNASISLRLFLSLTLSAMLFDIHMVLHMRKCKTIPVRHMRSISTYVGICRPCTYVMSRTAQKCRPCARGLSQCTRNAMHSRSPSLSANPSDGRADKRRRRRRRRICDAEYV